MKISEVRKIKSYFWISDNRNVVAIVQAMDAKEEEKSNEAKNKQLRDSIKDYETLAKLLSEYLPDLERQASVIREYFKPFASYHGMYLFYIFQLI